MVILVILFFFMFVCVCVCLLCCTIVRRYEGGVDGRLLPPAFHKFFLLFVGCCVLS